MERLHILVDEENEYQGHTVHESIKDSNPDLSDHRCECLTATHITLVPVPPWVGPWLRGQALGQTNQVQVLALAPNCKCDLIRELFS